MTSSANGINCSTADFWGVNGGPARTASLGFMLFIFACSLMITRRWTFFTTSLMSCSRSSLSLGEIHKEDSAMACYGPNCRMNKCNIFLKTDKTLFPSKTVDCIPDSRTRQSIPPNLHGYPATILECLGAKSPCTSMA